MSSQNDPKKRSKKSKHPSTLTTLRQLAPFMARLSRGRMRGDNWFNLCVRASLSKCYQFNIAARTTFKNKAAFFAMPTLRGICEDLIVFRFLRKLPKAEREKLILATSRVELATRSHYQSLFFSRIRPQQPVLSHANSQKEKVDAEDAVRKLWNSHGWPGLKNQAAPPIRQVAEKPGDGALLVLYEYLYRLTSGAVHFNVQSLLRSG